MRCGHCKGDHTTVAEVRECSGVVIVQGAYGPTKASEGTHSPRRARTKPKRSAATAPVKVPPGRYAVPSAALGSRGDDRPWRFFLAEHGKEGSKWDGFVFLSELLGAPGNFKKFGVRDRALREIVSAAILEDAKAASLAFGRETGQCGVCGSPLTDATSVALGIGPVCRSKKGW